MSKVSALREPDDSRIKDIIRGFIAGRSGRVSRPDMRNEHLLLLLCKVIIDEVKAQNPALLVSERALDTLDESLAKVQIAYEDLLRQYLALKECKRGNIEPTEKGIKICWGLHEKGEPCSYIEYVPADSIKPVIDPEGGEYA